MKKVITIVLALILGVTYAPLRAESAEPVTGECQAQMGDLSGENEAKINEIATLINTGNDLKMLVELHDFLQQDPASKQNARPVIQKILASVIAQEEIKVTVTKEDEEYAKKAIELTSLYVDDPDMYPEFSYEASICNEVALILTTAMLHDMFANMPSLLDTDQVTSWRRTVNSIKSSMGEITKSGMATLWERPLDVCAKKQLWEYAERLLGGGPYWSEGGIESNSGIVAGLKIAYENEQHEVIREIAGKVMNKIAPQQEGIGYALTANVPLYSEASLTGSVNTYVKKGTKLIILQTADESYKVKAPDGTIGWVSKSKVKKE